VQHDRLEVALVLRRAREVGELLLRTDRTQRSGRHAVCGFEVGVVVVVE
jgi:hypothetical protein